MLSKAVPALLGECIGHRETGSAEVLARLFVQLLKRMGYVAAHHLASIRADEALSLPDLIRIASLVAELGSGEARRVLGLQLAKSQPSRQGAPSEECVLRFHAANSPLFDQLVRRWGWLPDDALVVPAVASGTRLRKGVAGPIPLPGGDDGSWGACPFGEDKRLRPLRIAVFGEPAVGKTSLYLATSRVLRANPHLGEFSVLPGRTFQAHGSGLERAWQDGDASQTSERTTLDGEVRGCTARLAMPFSCDDYAGEGTEPAAWSPEVQEMVCSADAIVFVVDDRYYDPALGEAQLSAARRKQATWCAEVLAYHQRCNPGTRIPVALVLNKADSILGPDVAALDGVTWVEGGISISALEAAPAVSSGNPAAANTDAVALLARLVLRKSRHHKTLRIAEVVGDSMTDFATFFEEVVRVASTCQIFWMKSVPTGALAEVFGQRELLTWIFSTVFPHYADAAELALSIEYGRLDEARVRIEQWMRELAGLESRHREYAERRDREARRPAPLRLLASPWQRLAGAGAANKLRAVEAEAKTVLDRIRTELPLQVVLEDKFPFAESRKALARARIDAIDRLAAIEASLAGS